MNRGPYVGPVVTVDVVSLRWTGEHLLLATHIRDREDAPFYRRRALPGAYMYAGDTIDGLARMILEERCGFEAEQVRHVMVADSVRRDPRGPSVSLVALETGRVVSAAHGTSLPTAFDHREIQKQVKEWGFDNLDPVIFELLPPEFVFRDMHKLAEKLGGRLMDRPNFRRDTKRFLTATGEERQNPKGGRPAPVYRKRTGK